MNENTNGNLYEKPPNGNLYEKTTSKNVEYYKNISKEERKINSRQFIEYTHNEQLVAVNKLYLNCTNHSTDSSESLSRCIQREINKKISGYKHQDIKKGIYDELLLIHVEDILEKLVASKLKCLYCKCIVTILYKCVREDSQWTLDRIDNDLCHSSNNTIVSCLKCNLKRRNINKDKFLFTRNLNIKKLE